MYYGQSNCTDISAAIRLLNLFLSTFVITIKPGLFGTIYTKGYPITSVIKLVKLAYMFFSGFVCLSGNTIAGQVGLVLPNLKWASGPTSHSPVIGQFQISHQKSGRWFKTVQKWWLLTELFWTFFSWIASVSFKISIVHHLKWFWIDSDSFSLEKFKRRNRLQVWADQAHLASNSIW